MTDDELIKAIRSFKDEIKAESFDSRLDNLGGALENPPVCTTLENIEATEDNTKLKVTTSADAYTFAFSGKLPALLDGFDGTAVDMTSTDKYTATLRFTGNVTVDQQNQKSVVLTWPVGRAIDGKSAEDVYKAYKKKREPSKYDNGWTKYKFDTAVFSSSLTGLSTSITGASAGITGAEFSLCVYEQIIRAVSFFGAMADIGVTATEVKVKSYQSKLGVFGAFLWPVTNMISAFKSEKDVFYVDL